MWGVVPGDVQRFHKQPSTCDLVFDMTDRFEGGVQKPVSETETAFLHIECQSGNRLV